MLAVEADVTSQEQAEELVERTVSELGRLDTLINNAGVMLLGPAVGAPLEEWERMVAVNVQGLLYCAHAALPHLLQRGRGQPRRVADMVNISSVAGRMTRAGSGVYNLTKHGVGAFSDSLRQEVTGRRVRVSLVEPGAVDTELRLHNRPEIQEQMEKRFGGIELLQARTSPTRSRSSSPGRGGWRSTRSCPADRAGASDRAAPRRRAEGRRPDGRPLVRA